MFVLNLFPLSFDLLPFASSRSSVTARPPAPVQSRLPAYSRSAAAESYARILRQDNDLDTNSYHYLYQTENGINAEESGNVANAGTKVSGYYEYVGDNGQKYRVDYIADENGFQPRGAHLPA